MRGEADRSVVMRSPCAGAALDPPLWIIVPNTALSPSLSRSTASRQSSASENKRRAPLSLGRAGLGAAWLARRRPTVGRTQGEWRLRAFRPRCWLYNFVIPSPGLLTLSAASKHKGSRVWARKAVVKQCFQNNENH